ncbi:MAG: site-2 protease family protein [Clostridia bacterium]|nr:site-2 protease family protein [Clostridia bacterium]
MIVILVTIVVVLISLSVHETAHGYVAYVLGDDTAKSMGRLSLNPLRHIDVIGFLMMLVAGFGWANAVPVNMFRFKNPKKGMAITALAGPLSNIILAFISCFVIYILVRFNIYNEILFYFLQMMFYANTSLAMFNLIPIPPLDGSKILFVLLPDRYYSKLMYIERYGFIILILIINTPIFNRVLSNGVYNLQKALISFVEIFIH